MHVVNRSDASKNGRQRYAPSEKQLEQSTRNMLEENDSDSDDDGIPAEKQTSRDLHDALENYHHLWDLEKKTLAKPKWFVSTDFDYLAQQPSTCYC